MRSCLAWMFAYKPGLVAIVKLFQGIVKLSGADCKVNPSVSWWAITSVMVD